MSIDLSTPWVATLNGNSLAPFPAFDRLVEDDEFPSAKEQLGWSRSEVATCLGRVSGKEGRAALWDSVVGVYRLKLLEEGSGVEWADHVRAWLVRYVLLASGSLLNSVGTLEPSSRSVPTLPGPTVRSRDELC